MDELRCLDFQFDEGFPGLLDLIFLAHFFQLLVHCGRSVGTEVAQNALEGVGRIVQDLALGGDNGLTCILDECGIAAAKKSSIRCRSSRSLSARSSSSFWTKRSACCGSETRGAVRAIFSGAFFAPAGPGIGSFIRRIELSF